MELDGMSLNLDSYILYMVGGIWNGAQDFHGPGIHALWAGLVNIMEFHSHDKGF